MRSILCLAALAALVIASPVNADDADASAECNAEGGATAQDVLAFTKNTVCAAGGLVDSRTDDADPPR